MTSSEHVHLEPEVSSATAIEIYVAPLAPPRFLAAQLRSAHAYRSTLAMVAVIAVHALVIGMLLHDPLPLANDGHERAGDVPAPLMIVLALGDSETDPPVDAPDPGLPITPVTDWSTQVPAVEFSDDAGVANATPAAPGGSPEQARYLAQIAARIERAWQASAPSGETPGRARCDVWVTQLPDGTVWSIEQVGCTGRAPDSAALLVAVQRSSPLPSAPDGVQFIANLAVSVDAEHGLVTVIPRRASDAGSPQSDAERGEAMRSRRWVRSDSPRPLPLAHPIPNLFLRDLPIRSRRWRTRVELVRQPRQLGMPLLVQRVLEFHPRALELALPRSELLADRIRSIRSLAHRPLRAPLARHLIP